jgi:hypothetical protein
LKAGVSSMVLLPIVDETRWEHYFSDPFPLARRSSLGPGRPARCMMPSSMSTPRDPRFAELETRFRELTLLMYDTSIPIPVLEERVVPYLAPDVVFVDPWLIARGRERFAIGLRGFHCAFRFDFEIVQVAVTPNAGGDGGRALVDGVMNLRQLRFYTYPLRTILAYDFTLRGGELRIERLEEMWSFGDMIANAPLLVGRLYQRAFRPAAGAFFTVFFWLSCALGRRASA